METARCRALVYAAELGSITKAAERMNYTPSAVSQLIQAMETEMDLQLLHRSKRGVALTEEGKKIIPSVKELLRQEERIDQLTAQIHGLETGTVRIAAYSSVATHWLPEVLRAFQTDYPGIEITLAEGIRQEVEGWLADRQADLAFMTYMEPMPYEWIFLAEDPMMAVLHPSHPLAKEKAYPLRACEEEPFIMPAQGMDEDVNRMIRENGLSLNIAFQTLENFSCIAMIEQNLGMSIMNRLITKRQDYDVVMLPLDPPQHIRFGIAVHSLESASPAVRRFVDYAVRMLGQEK